MLDQETEQRPGQNVFDPEFIGWLQGKGLIDVRGPKPGKYRTPLDSEEERQFQVWYRGIAAKTGIDPNPDNPLHHYDYRGAYKAGATPEVNPDDKLYHWPSEFKDEDHPNRFVNGEDTRGEQDIPINIQQDLKDDYLHFIKGKGYSVLNEPLPSKEEAAANLEKSTAQLRDLMLQKYGSTIGPTTREAVESQPAASVSGVAAMQGPHAETIGRPRPSERIQSFSEIQAQKLPQEASFWKQVGDALSLIPKGKVKEAIGMFVDAGVNGLTLGIIGPEQLDKVDQLFLKAGISSSDYKTLKERRASTLDALGYYPAKAAGAISFVYSVLPVFKIAKFARGIGAGVTSIPAMQRLVAAAVGGTATGGAQIAGEALAGKKFEPEKDLKKIPTHMLWWGLFEFGTLGAETAAKIVNWNLKYAGKIKGTGKYGGYGAAQGVEIGTEYAPGRGPTMRTEFTAEELRRIFIKARGSTRPDGTLVEPLLDWEKKVYDSLSGASGWKEALRRGWMSPSGIEITGEPPVITGYNLRRTGAVAPEVGGEQIPMKPDVGQIFRKGGAARPWPAPEIIETAQAAPGAVTRPAPPPPTTPPPGITGAPGAAAPETPPPGPPPAGSAPPAISGAPAAGAGAPPPTPKAKPKIKVTPQEDGSFTVENVEEPAPPPEVKPVEPEPKPEARKDQAIRDAINRIQADEGAPEDVRIVAQAARRSERLKKVVEGLKARQRTDLLTGVGSDRALARQRGWEQRPVVLFDLAGVKSANNDPKRGYTWTDDNIFKPAGRIFRAFGDDRIYRRGGTADEFPLIGKPGQTLEDLQKDAELISEQLNNAGVEHRFAAGNNFPEAEVGMAGAKEKGRVQRTTSPLVPETLEELEPFIVRGAEEVATMPGEPEEYLTMTGKMEDAIATLARDDAGGINIKRAIDGSFVKNPRTGLPDFPNRKVAWEAYLEERKGRGLRGASPAFPSKRFIKSLETPEERVRRIFKSRQEAQKSRGRTGAPKEGPQIFADILDITHNKGIKPPLNSRGGIMEEYKVNVPRFLKNKNGMPYDEIIDALEKEAYNYKFDEDDFWGMLKDADMGRGGEEGAPEEPDAEEMQRQLDEMKKQYAPLMNKDENLEDFFGRMAREAAEDGFGTDPEDVDEYIADLLKKKGGGEPQGGAPGEVPPTPFLVSVKNGRGQGLWWPDEKMKDGSPVLVADPFIPASAPGAGPDVYSNNVNVTYSNKFVTQIEGWKNTLRRWSGKIEDPGMIEFEKTIKEIYEETDHYGFGNMPNVPFTSPTFWNARIRDGYNGYLGGRSFHLKYLVGADATARLIAPKIQSNFAMLNPLYFGDLKIANSIGTVGAMYDPSHGILCLNPFWIQDGVLDSAWGLAAYWRDIVVHELTHFWEPVHNEAFTSQLLDNNARMSSVWPYIVRIAEKVIDKKAILDKRKSFIALGPGRGQEVSNTLIRTAGEEAAKAVALGKENKGDRSLYAAIPKFGDKAAGGGGTGRPGEAGVSGAGRGSQLPYPPEAPGGRPQRLQFGQKPPGLEPRPIEPPPGEFGLTPPEENAPPFKPEKLEGRQGVLPMVEGGPLFKAAAARPSDADNIIREVVRLTSREFFPREWQGNTEEEVKDNRQNLARFVLENYKPEMGPLENFINANKGFFIRGEAGRKGMAKIKREGQFPRTPSGKEADFGPEKSVFAPESQPKNVRPPDPEIPGAEVKPDVFGAEEIAVVNALRSAAQAHNKTVLGPPENEDKLVEILKSRILSDMPESFESIGKRIGWGRETVRENFYQMLEGLRDNDVVKEIQRRHMIQHNLGPVPSEEDLRRLAKILRKYFSSYRGADKIIDTENDKRVGGKMSEIFNQTLDTGVIKSWLDKEPEAVNDYATGLMTGALSGDAYSDILNSEIPFKVKEAMLTTRARIDRLSEIIVTYGALAEDTKVAFERNLGKYLTKAYRLWEDKHWSPTPAQKEGFKRFLMNQYSMTPEQADGFIEAELAYGRNDEGIRPRRSRKTRRIPTEHYIRRKQLTPEWRSFAGEIDRLPWLVLNTVTKQATMAYNAKFLDWIADYLPDHWTADYQEAAQRGWQNAGLPDHNYAYGKLAGKWVDPELHQYIKQEFDVNRSDVEEMIQRFIMNPFKWTKTIGSIPAQIRNPLSNIGLSILGRNTAVNPLNLKWYLKSLLAHKNRTGSARELWTEMIARGVTGTQYYGEEIPKIQKSVMRFDQETWLDDLWDGIVKWPINKLGEAYNFGDSLFRVATYLHDTEGRGMDPQKAVDELNAGLQNYRKLPVIVDILRRWPVLGPFISFKANVVTIMARQAKMAADEMSKPETRGRGFGRAFRLALFLSIPLILSEVSKRIFDVDEDQIKKLEQYYPSYRRGGTFIYFRGENDQLKVFDLSYVWPTGDVQRMFKSILNGDIAGLKDATDFFSHPLFDLWNIVIKGEDPQWGTKYRTIVDRAKAAVAYLYLPASMPIPNLKGIVEGDLRPGALTGPQIKNIIDAFNQQPDKYGRVKKLPEEVKNFFTGIRTWDVVPDKLLAQSAVARSAQIRELQAEYTNWIVRNSKAPQWEIEDKKKAFLSEVEKLTTELREIGVLREELSKHGFKLTRY